MTDDRDRRTLHSILNKFYTPDIIENEQYYFDETQLYFAPPDGEVRIRVRGGDDRFSTLPLDHWEMQFHFDESFKLFLSFHMTGMT